LDEKIIAEGGAKQYKNEVNVAMGAIKSAGLIMEGESYEVDFKDGVLKINDEVIPTSTVDSLSFNKDIQFEVEMDVEKDGELLKSTKKLKVIKEEDQEEQ
jgi:hypothetical protein